MHLLTTSLLRIEGEKVVGKKRNRSNLFRIMCFAEIRLRVSKGYRTESEVVESDENERKTRQEGKIQMQRTKSCEPRLETSLFERYERREDATGRRDGRISIQRRQEGDGSISERAYEEEDDDSKQQI